MNIDDFPFNELLGGEEKGNRKVGFNSLILKVHVYLLKERKEEWKRVKESRMQESDKELWLVDRIVEDGVLILDVMEVYMKMGCVKENGVFSMGKAFVNAGMLRWMVGNDIYGLDLNKEEWPHWSCVMPF